MKKLLSFALVALMVLSCIAPVFAVSSNDVPGPENNTIDMWCSDAVIDENNQATVTVSLANNIGFWSIWSYVIYPKCLTLDENAKTYLQTVEEGDTSSIQSDNAILEEAGDINYGLFDESAWVNPDLGAALELGYGVDISDLRAQVAELVKTDPDCLACKKESDAVNLAWSKLGYTGPSAAAWDRAFGFDKYHYSGNLYIEYRDGIATEFLQPAGPLYDLTFTYHPELNTEGLKEFEIIFVANPENTIHAKNETYPELGTPVTLRIQNGKITLKEETPAIMYGDVNGDGKINNTDVLMLKRYIRNYNAETGTSTVNVKVGADVNGDGKINNTDVLMLKRYIRNYNAETGESTIKLGPRT